jgi:multiple sugar transport system permease protein
MPRSYVALPTKMRAQTGVSTQKRRFWSTDNPTFWLLPAMGMLLFYSIFPLFYNLWLSFHEWQTRRKVFLPVDLDNWKRLIGVSVSDTGVLSFVGSDFYNAMAVTFQYTILCLGAQLVLGLLIALMLDAKPWGANLMQTVIILPMVTMPAVAGFMFRLLQNDQFGPISWLAYGLRLLTPSEPFLGGTGRFALTAVAMVDIWQWTPFFVLILLAGLKAIPTELTEAAEVDGANWTQRLFRIKLPLLGGVLAIAILFRLVDLYKMIDYIYTMTSGGPGISTMNLSYYGYVNTFNLIKYGFGATVGVAVLLLGWITAWTYQRVFRIHW